MTPDFVTLMAASKNSRTFVQSALPDAPVVEEFIDRSVREPWLVTLRKRLATLIWPCELESSPFHPPSPVTSC